VAEQFLVVRSWLQINIFKIDQPGAKRVAAPRRDFHARRFNPPYLQKSLNGAALNCAYLVVCWIDRWPSQSWMRRVSWRGRSRRCGGACERGPERRSERLADALHQAIDGVGREGSAALGGENERRVGGSPPQLAQRSHLVAAQRSPAANCDWRASATSCCSTIQPTPPGRGASIAQDFTAAAPSGTSKKFKIDPQRLLYSLQWEAQRHAAGLPSAAGEPRLYTDVEREVLKPK
jgi:hypothetical protein